MSHGEDGETGDDGADGADALVRLEEGPAGDNCSDRGWKVLVGKDTDGDGTLGDAVCLQRKGRSVGGVPDRRCSGG